MQQLSYFNSYLSNTSPLSPHFSCLAIKKTPTLLQTLHLHTHTPNTHTPAHTQTPPTHCVYVVLVRPHRYVLLFIINLRNSSTKTNSVLHSVLH
jgi:hypothetical protein